MRHRNLFNLLAALNKEEFKRFGKFLKSPYFTNSRGMVTFYIYLKRFFPEFDEGKMDLESAFPKLFPERLKVKKGLSKAETAIMKSKMLYNKLSHLQSDMYRLLETFLTVEEALFDHTGLYKGEGNKLAIYLPARQSAIPYKDELLVKALSRRSFFDLYVKTSNSLIKRLECLPIKNVGDYWLLSQLHHWRYYHPSTHKTKLKEVGFLEAMYYLDSGHMLSKLRYIAEWYAYSQVKPIDAEIPFLEETIQQAITMVAEKPRKVSSSRRVLIEVYLELVELYRGSQGETRFRRALELFLNHHKKLPILEQTFLFTHFFNNGVRLYALEGQPIGRDLFAMYRWALEQGLMVVNERMAESTYLNISALATECGKYNWAKKFMKTWKPCLDEKFAEEATQAALCHLNFCMGEIDKAYGLLKEIPTDRMPYYFMSRSLELKVYYEKSLKDRGFLSLAHHSASVFAKFIDYQTANPVRREAWLNFAQFTRRLVSLLINEGRVSGDEKIELQSDLDSMKYVFSRKWLSEKIAVLPIK